MKKSLLVLTAALSFGVAAAQTAAPASAPQVPALTDVPAGHWAKDAIDKLVGSGIILGYPDGTYRGTQNLTRYEAAVIIARLLEDMKTGTVVPGDMDSETLTALQNAIQELAADLAALGVRVSDLEENAVSRDDFARLEERVEAIALQTGEPEALAGLTSQIEELTARADDYDTLRADVDDNASSIAALNDLTVLLNQDILNLQDRVSAVEAAQADLVARADFDTLSGRVGVVETKVTSLDNRVAQLEKYAFNIKPSLSATYFVGRATRDMDIDRLLAGTVLATGDDGDTGTSDAARDYADFSGDQVLVGAGATNFYGFSTAGGVVNKEGETTLDFSIEFGNSGKLTANKSDVTGAYVKSAGGLSVNKVDVSFGIRAGLPDDAVVVDEDGNVTTIPGYDFYPDVYSDDSGYTYTPLFFYFDQGTVDFTVGNTPVVVTFGKGLKFKFADYIGDNDYADGNGRGDGYNVKIDGSTLPVIGAFKPTINTVYGSRGGRNGDNQYYRGVRATITPVGTLVAGVHVLQEGVDAFGVNQATQDVTAYGADLHGQIAGWQLDSEYAQSNISPSRVPGSVVEKQNAFYAKTSGSLGPIKVYEANYRSVSAGYDAVAGIMEAAPRDTDNGSTAPYVANRTGFGVKAKGTLGPVSIGGYVDNSVAYGKSPLETVNEPSAIVNRGVAAKVSLFNLVTVRGGYYELLTGTAAPVNYLGDPEIVANFQGRNLTRTSVSADVTPGLGFSVGAYYREVNLNGTKVQNDGAMTYYAGEFGNAGNAFTYGTRKYNSSFGLANDELNDNSGCSEQQAAIRSTDADMVGRALTFTQNSFSDVVCYTAYGVEIGHNGKDANALVKGLTFRAGFAQRYRDLTKAYSNNFIYGDVLYSNKIGAAQVDLKGIVSSDRYAEQTTKDLNAPNSLATAFGVKVVTDTLNVAFKPSLEGQFGYYSRSYDFYDATGTASRDYTSDAMKYVVGVKLNEFLLPNTKLAVYYAGYQGKNRIYRDAFTATTLAGGAATAGTFRDSNTGATIRQNLVYVEGNYYDLSFGYGYGTLTMRDAAGQAVTGAADAKGSVFKINYKVNF
ncbi:S-layer homology domain-containing protein [Deinococcus sp. 23YEL01]|uniref:S-layer homology domain-containing protein n=1 Tax=Deinococcus sp. 23YEL01 TaxID=2745871 RepID=UPI001E4BF290|nr:S-layer homology domain-containing protein [Deinococcus sp. 23YEL01]MCD0170404.1 S-layer homology domain-containing protein [Deinococcus sp. 23YEL01]